MEIQRNHQISISNAVVCAGFLLSSSSIYYYPLQENLLSLISVNYWIFVLTLFLALTIGSFLYYVLSSHCSFILELAQYLFLPLSFLIVVHIITEDKIVASQMSFSFNQQSIIAIIITLFICAIITVKVLLINQLFPGDQSLQILSAGIYARLYRICKLLLLVVLILTLQPSQSIIVFFFCNAFDMLVIFYNISFARMRLEKSMIAGAMNNVPSILILTLNFYLSKAPLYGISEIFFLCFCYFTNISQLLVQLKYLKVLNKFDSQNFMVFEDCSEQVKIALSQCFYQVIVRDKDKDYSIETSLHFETAIKQFYLLQIFQHFNNKSFKGDQLVVILFDELQANIVKFYNMSKYGGSAKSPSQVISDLTLFKDLLACGFHRSQNTHSSQKWLFYDECFLSLTCHLKSNFVMKGLQIYYRRKAVTSQNIFYHARNSKLLTYIKHYQRFHLLTDASYKDKMIFESSLKELKRQIIDTCTEEIILIEQIVKPSANMSIYQQKLTMRHQNKRRVLKLFERSFSSHQYLLFDQFVFCYLLFEIIFCKSIAITSKNIREKFMIPSKKMINVAEDVPTLLCCGVDEKKHEIGSIMATNISFRKKFQIQNDKRYERNQKISDLIPFVNLRKKHHELMKSVTSFNSSVESTLHQELTCYLKVNMSNDSLDVIQAHKISTSIFYTHPDIFAYFCVLKPQNEEYFMTIEQCSQAETFQKSIKTVERISKHDPIQITQFGEKIQLVQCDNLETRKHILKVENDENIQADGSIIVNICSDEQREKSEVIETKYSRMEEKIASERLMSKQFVAFSAAALAFFILAIFSILFITYLQKLKKTEIQEMVNVENNVIASVSSNQLHFAFFYTIIRGVNTSKISDNVCNPVIPSINSYVRDKMSEYYRNKFNVFFQESITFSQNRSKLMPLFKQRDYRFPETHQQNLLIDYSNYILGSKSMALEYIDTDFNEQTAEQTAWMKYVINLMSQADQLNSQNKCFTLDFSNKIRSVIISNEIEIKYLQKIKLTVFFACILMFFVFFFRANCEFLRYFSILEKINDSYFFKRIFQVKFIRKELRAMDGYKFHKCKFYSADKITIISESSQATISREYTIEEFEKLAEDENQSIVIDFRREELKKPFIIRALVSRKTTLLIMFIFILGMGVAINLGSIQVVKLLKGIYEIHEIMIENEKVREAFLGVFIANWFKDQRSEQYRTEEKNAVIFNSNNEILKTNKLMEMTTDRFSQQLLNRTIYQDICVLLEKKDAECQELTMKNKYMELLSIFAKSQQIIWHKLNVSAEYSKAQSLMCRDTTILLDFLEPSILKVNAVALDYYDHFLKLEALLSDILMYVTIAASMLFTSIKIYEMYRNFKICRHQILTFDTPQDLYTYPEYRPLLNKLYFQYTE